MDVVLDAEERSRWLPGVLLGPDGSCAEGGRVVAGGEGIDVGPGGRFRLDRTSLEPGAEIWGFVPGRLPDRHSYDPRLDRVELVAGGPARAIEGRVLDADGRPVAGAFVWALDPTPLAPGARGFFAETHVHPDPGAPVPLLVPSDGEGRFRLPFLLERDYGLGALRREDLTAVESGPVPAGARGIELRLPEVARSPVLGRVLDGRGRPIAGARVTAHRKTVRVRDLEGRELSASIRGISARADDEGWFALPPLPEQELFLDATAEGCFPSSPDLPLDAAARDHVEIVVGRRAVLELASSGEAGPITHVIVLSVEGHVLDLLPADEMDESYGVIPRSRLALVRGEPRLVLVPDTAYSVVAFDGGREVARRSIEWSPEGPTRIEF